MLIRISSFRNLMLCVVPAAILIAVALLLATTDSWHLISIEHAFGATYADLRYLTATAECFRQNPEWSLLSATCDPFGRPNNYPPPWVWLFAALRVDQSGTEAIAVFYIFLFSMSVAAFTWGAIVGKPRPAMGAAIMCLIVLAPATWSAIERGSNEIVIFAGIALSWVLFSRGMRRSSALLLGILTVLKFFPAGALAAYVPGIRHHKAALTVFILVAAGGLFIIGEELSTIRSRTPQPTDAAFGAAVLVRQIDLPAGRVIGFVAFTCLVVALFMLLRCIPRGRLSAAARDLSRDIQADGIASSLIAFGAGPLVLAYLLGSNYDYRLILTIPLVAGLLRVRSRAVARTLLVGIILASWMAYPMHPTIQLVGDLILLVTMPVLFLILLLPTAVGKDNLAIKATST
jgi:hypothetical protein